MVVNLRMLVGLGHEWTEHRESFLKAIGSCTVCCEARHNNILLEAKKENNRRTTVNIMLFSNTLNLFSHFFINRHLAVESCKVNHGATGLWQQPVAP